MPRPLRATRAALALAAYLLPLVVGLTAYLGHGAEHALDLIRTLEDRAEAMGVAHLHDASAHRTYVHSHGGALHPHDASVGKLLVASQEAEDQHDGAPPPPLELSCHVPATSVSLPLLLATRAATDAEPGSSFPRTLLPPPLPPPRA